MEVVQAAAWLVAVKEAAAKGVAARGEAAMAGVAEAPCQADTGAVTAGVMGRCQTRTQPCDTAARSAASLWAA